MKKQTEKTETKPITPEAVAKALISMTWSEANERGYALIDELDMQRREGSKITTARQILQEMSRIGRGSDVSWYYTPALTLTLEWLYYRRSGKEA
jgi:hypothetical protein